MNPPTCEMEPEVLAAVLEGRWAGAADGPLREHAAHCEICAEVAAVAGALGEARETERQDIVVPDSARVWWVARMRARREAIRAAGRPITAAQVIAFACIAGLLGACFGATSTWFQATLQHMIAAAAGLDWRAAIPSATTVMAQHGLLIAAMGIVLLLAPAAVYLALRKE